MRTNNRFFLLAVTLVATAACNNSKSDEGNAHAAMTTANAATAAAATATPASAALPTAEPVAEKPIEITLSTVGDTMAFDKAMLIVQTGKTVHITVKNKGTMAVMQHNWVLVKPGTEAAVALDGLNNAPDAGYVVPGPNVLAASNLAAPGGVAEVTFVAPAPGKYPYICTFPGHYMTMKGVLTVTP
jgi:azurin